MANQNKISKKDFDKYSNQLVRISCGEKDGTGFFIGETFILTAAHNLIGESVTDKATIKVFWQKKSINISMNNVLRNEEFLDPDCALIKLSAAQKQKFDVSDFFKLSQEHPVKDEEYHVAGFEYGDESLTSRSPKYVGPFEKANGKSLYSEYLNYIDIPESIDLDRYENADIKGGFSGAPIVNENLEVIGIVTFEYEGRAYGCYSVQLDKIKTFIESLDDRKDFELSALIKQQGLLSKPSKQFTKKGDVIQCYVIESSTEENEQKNPRLRNVVNRALEKYETNLYKITKKTIETKSLACNIDEIVKSAHDLDIVIQILCQVEIVIFDVTNFEPAVMLLLGLRSVVRRGVTIASYGGEYEVGNPIDTPFTIKEVNILSHSRNQRTQIDLIGEKIIAGFEQLVHMPDYLDLPVYDAIRTLPPNKDQRTPKEYFKQILVLCPFSSQYTENNWKDFLKPQLSATFTYDGMSPKIVRTLDMKSPRLVSQSLYQEMRLTQLCIIDWTNWQPNVFFELGVRLAANGIEPICIIESDEKEYYTEKDVARLAFTENQRNKLLGFFNLFEYKAPKQGRIKDEEYGVYREMLKYYKQRGQSNGKMQKNKALSYGFIYNIISNHIDVEKEFSTLNIYEELIRNADLLDHPQKDSEGRSSLLFPNNKSLNTKAIETALEMRLAAWYYSNNRMIDDLLSNEKLFKDFKNLGNLLASALRRSDREKAKQIRKRISDLELKFNTLKNKNL